MRGLAPLQVHLYEQLGLSDEAALTALGRPSHFRIALQLIRLSRLSVPMETRSGHCSIVYTNCRSILPKLDLPTICLYWDMAR